MKPTHPWRQEGGRLYSVGVNGVRIPLAPSIRGLKVDWQAATHKPDHEYRILED
jgi:hypothetical protein